ncbi:hypothetical protein [Agromyces ramosus]|uniref:Drug/metabolite transporter (DMT)-like permease n=1 Tax=Agromyces ramosus TaxID=33879 RepID=A0ABU0RAX4_9MICO|nr:hypothetical protein [Agromyces ramosus]MDQ0895229.1 drug/metabolite transporter (DMT)-like permease [Agromyces ramosus]
MRRIRDIRIIRWELKLAYVVGVYAAIFSLAALLRALGSAETLVWLTTGVFDVAALLVGARVFRGRGEAIEPPRPWWRMTARPTLSRRLGILFVVLATGSVVAFILSAVGVYEPLPQTSTSETIAIYVTSGLEYAAFAYFYLNSAVRLRRLGVPAKPPKFRPTVKLG